MQLPKRIFFTGVPGSRWSGIAQILEDVLDLDTSDRNKEREYDHTQYSGHKGAYFGTGMEFEAKFGLVDEPFEYLDESRLIKSHEWSRMIPQIINHFPNDGMIIIHRDTYESFKWWKEAGGFDITYPDYSAYKDETGMLTEIHNQSLNIESFCLQNNIQLKPFNNEWIKNNFQRECNKDLSKYEGIKAAYIKWKNG